MLLYIELYYYFTKTMRHRSIFQMKSEYCEFKTNAFFINAIAKSATKRTKKSISTNKHFQSDMT